MSLQPLLIGPKPLRKTLDGGTVSKAVTAEANEVKSADVGSKLKPRAENAMGYTRIT